MWRLVSLVMLAILVGALEASPASAQSAGNEAIQFKLESAAAVQNGPSARTVFTLGQTSLITKIRTYHWNNGQGASPGTIGLRNVATGQFVGNWSVVATYHMFSSAPGASWPARGDGPPFLYWTSQPNVQVVAGTYEVVDSAPNTWSTNAEVRNMGVAWVYGRAQAPTPGPVGSSGTFTLTAVTPIAGTKPWAAIRARPALATRRSPAPRAGWR